MTRSQPEKTRYGKNYHEKKIISHATFMFLNFKVIFSCSLVGEGIIVAAKIMELTSLFRSIKVRIIKLQMHISKDK